MGMYSSFNYEDEIEIYDDEFYNYLKDIKKKEGEDVFTRDDIIRWYDENKVDGKLPKFSFTMFDGWKIQGYWYDEFCKVISIMGKFLKPNCHGYAEFTYEEGQPFKFICNGEDKEVSVEYVPLVWENMDFKKFKTKIPKKYLDRIKQSEVEDEI